MRPISRQIIGFIAAVIIVGVGGYYLGHGLGYKQGHDSLILKRAYANVTGTLHVFEWSEYEVPELWDTFKIMYPNVKVKFTFFVDESEALTKLKAGFKPDIVHPCGSSVRRWYDAGVIEPVNISLIPNWDDMFDDLKEYCENYTKFNGEHYFVPADWGYSTILYRRDLLEDLEIPEEEWDSYNLLFDYREELEGKIALMDSAVEVTPMAAIAAGVPIDHIWDMSETEMDMTRDKLDEGKPLVYAYWETEADVASWMAEGAIVAANVWGESTPGLLEEGYDVVLSEPEQGRLLWVCGFSIVEGLKDRNPELYEAAHAYINAWLDPVAGAWLIDSYWYGSPNSKAPALVEYPETMEILGFGSTEVISRSILWEYTPNEEDWVSMWNDYRAAG